MFLNLKLKKTMVAGILCATLVSPSHAFVGVAVQIAGGLIELGMARARFGDMMDANVSIQAGDYPKAYATVKQGFLANAASNGEKIDFDEILRLRKLNEWSFQPEQAKDFELLLLSQEARFLASDSPMIRSYYYFFRTQSAEKLDKRSQKRYFLRKTLAEAKSIVDQQVSSPDLIRFDFGKADGAAKDEKRKMEFQMYDNYINFLNNEALAALSDGQELDALALKKQSVELFDKVLADVRKINPNLEQMTGLILREKSMLPYFAYYAGEEKSADVVIDGLLKTNNFPSLLDMLIKAGRAEDAELVAKSMLISLNKATKVDPANRTLFTSLLTQALFAQGKYAEAEKLIVTTIEQIKSANPGLPVAGENMVESEALVLLNTFLAEAYLRQPGKESQAKAATLHSLAHVNTYLRTYGKLPLRRYLVSNELWRGILGSQLTLLASSSENAEQILEVMQLVKNSEVADVLGEVAARFATGEGEMSQLIRRTQDLRMELKAVDKRLSEPKPEAAQAQTAVPQVELKEKRQQLYKELSANNDELFRRFPDYAELTKPALVSLSELSRLVTAKEALLSWFIGEKESILIVAKAGQVRSFKIQAGREVLSKLVEDMHRQLDPATGNLADFDFNTAHKLYSLLLKPAASMLNGISHLHIVSDGIVGSLPFSVLLTEKFEGKKNQLAHAPWLIKKYSFSVLPAISSLRSLRRTAKASQANQPFVGIGDPLFSDHPTLGGKPTLAAARTFKVRNVLAGGIADPQSLRSVPSLPETADELEAIAVSLGSNAKSLYLREQATEKNVRSLPLKNYQVIAFATHGIVSDDIKGVSEPGLLLTPPAVASEEDDGVLTASEVAGMKLDADWALLSACNTAAADGKPGAEGLSGLAKAFAFAGARSLVVSHWSVISDSTVALNSKMFHTYTSTKVSKSEAQRQAMLNLINSPNGKFAHPTYWAPFVIVGDGGEVGRNTSARK